MSAIPGDDVVSEDPGYRGSGKLQDKVALVTGGDSGIGRAQVLHPNGGEIVEA